MFHLNARMSAYSAEVDIFLKNRDPPPHLKKKLSPQKLGMFAQSGKKDYQVFFLMAYFGK